MLKKWLGRFTGRSRTQETPATSRPAEEENRSPAPAEPDRLITVYDSYGRELEISIADWRSQVLQPNLQKHWNDADQLYQMILSALNDGLFEDVEPASARLVEVDDVVERSHTIRGIVLLKLRRLSDARQILEQAVAQVGRTGTLLTNLAKVAFEEGQTERSEQLLHEAVQADPNLDNGLMWWLAQHQERGGKPAYVAALQTASAYAGSWRPQLWLARHHLEEKDLDSALSLYRQILAEGHYQPDALLMISGDLGNNGHEPLIVDLILPVYDVHRHPPQAGFNLLEAMIRQERVDQAEALLSQLYSLSIAPYKQHLDRYADRLIELRNRSNPLKPIDEAEFEINVLPLDRPVWSYGLGQPKWLLQQKPAEAERVLFLPFSLVDRSPDAPGERREDDAGRFSRALPLYLAESVHEWSARMGVFHLPVVRGGGPVVFARELDGEGLCEKFGEQASYIVTGTIDESPGQQAWRVGVKIWHCASGSCMAETQRVLSGEQDDAAVLALEDWLHEQLKGRTNAAFDGLYRRVPDEALQIYLVALGQSLMLTLVHNEIAPKGGLWGERKMIDFPLSMALRWPDVHHLKIFYLSGIGKAAGYGSDVLHEYSARTLQLLREAEQLNSPLARLKPLVWKSFGMRDSLAAVQPAREAEPLYREWLEELLSEG